MKKCYCKALKDEFYVENEVVFFSLTNGRKFKVEFSKTDKDTGVLWEILKNQKKGIALTGPHNEFSARYFTEWCGLRKNLTKMIYVLDVSFLASTQSPFYCGNHYKKTA